MIGLRVNNEWLDLKSPEIQVLERGIIQDADDEFGSFTYPFTVVASPRNDKILKHARLVNSIIDEKLIDAELHINGTLYAKGILKLIEANRQGYRCSFVFMPFAPGFLDQKLSAIFTETFFTYAEYADFLSAVGSKMINPDVWEKGNVTSDDNCRFPMWWNPYFYSETSANSPNDEFQELVNWFDKDTSLPIDNTIENEDLDFPSGYQIYPTHNRNTFVPLFFAGFVLEKIMNKAGLSFDGDFIDDERTSRLLVYNNAAMDNFKFPGYIRLMEENFAFPAGNITQSMAVVESHRNRLQLGSYLPAEWGYLCGFKASYVFAIKIKFSVPVSQDYRLVLRFKENIAGAMTYPYEVIDTTVTITGQTYENTLNWDGFIMGDFIEFDFIPVLPSPDAEKIEIEIFAPAYRESLGGGAYTYHLFEKLNIAPETNKVSRHMPDISVREFLQALRKMFNLKIEPSKTRPHIDFNFVANKINQLPSVDLTTKALENPTISFRDTREFLLQYNHAGDQRGENFAPPVGNLKGNNSIMIPAGVPEMVALSSGNLDGTHRMFDVIEKGSTSIDLGGDSLIAYPTPYRVFGPMVNESDADSKAALKFVSWFGVDTGSDFNYASSDDLLPDGQTVDASFYNLRTARILSDFWQTYLDKIDSGQSVKYGFVPDGFELSKVSIYKLYTIAWTAYLLEELTYIITQSGKLKDVEIRGLKQ
jgi:hypothetical protein